MPKPASPVIILTGASGGIGLALAARLYGSSYRVIAAALPDSLSVLDRHGYPSTEHFVHCPLDLRDPTTFDGVVGEAVRRWSRVDVLINNAGIAFRGVAEHMADDEEQEQMAINMFGPMSLTRKVLPIMRRQRSGHIVNVSSVGGMMAMPTMSSYSASKWALEGASEALWYEMRPFGVRVTLIQPGFIHSDAFRKVRLPRRLANGASAAPYEAYYRNMTRFVTWLMEHALATNDSVAAVTLRQIRKRRPPLRVQATLDAWIFNALRRFLPRRVYHPLLYRLLPGIGTWGRDEELP